MSESKSPFQITPNSPAAPEEIAEVVATAERMCFLMDTIREPHEVRNSTSLNGEPLD